MYLTCVSDLSYTKKRKHKHNIEKKDIQPKKESEVSIISLVSAESQNPWLYFRNLSPIFSWKFPLLYYLIVHFQKHIVFFFSFGWSWIFSKFFIFRMCLMIVILILIWTINIDFLIVFFSPSESMKFHRTDLFLFPQLFGLLSLHTLQNFFKHFFINSFFRTIHNRDWTHALCCRFQDLVTESESELSTYQPFLIQNSVDNGIVVNSSNYEVIWTFLVFPSIATLALQLDPDLVLDSLSTVNNFNDRSKN